MREEHAMNVMLSLYGGIVVLAVSSSCNFVGSVHDALLRSFGVLGLSPGISSIFIFNP